MDPLSNERRQGDRRAGDRRHRGGRRRDDSWFGSLGGDALADTDSFFDPGWLAAGDAAGDSRFLRRQAWRSEQSRGSSLVRVYRTYAAARALVGLGLVTAQGLGSVLGVRGSEWLALLSLGYAAQAVTLWLLPRFGALVQPQTQPRQRRRQWAMTIGVDLLAFSLLHVTEAGSALNFAALLVLPVLMSGVLTSRLMALATASAVSLLLLVAAWRGALPAELPLVMLQSGLAGLGLFAIALLAGELAGRLAREELTARGSLELARQQAQLNRLVIEEMADGVLVVDHHLRVRAANPAARALLVDQGLAPPSPFTLHDRPGWSALAQAVERALAEGSWPDGGRDVALALTPTLARTLRLRVRFMRGAPLVRAADGPGAPEPPDAPGAPGAPAPGDVAQEPFVVLLMEDLRTLQARIRQEKLAAMGRVSAGIAHEIRNPLSAIAQANALLMEDGLPAPQQQLARIVADNVARLKRLADDVMELAPGVAAGAQTCDARAAVRADAADWARTAGVDSGADGRLRVEAGDAPLPVSFDPEHLRRVLVNLLDNAQRHASAAPGAIVVRLAARDADNAVLSVASDGPRIAPEVEPFLFEPFFSTRSRGSGLGLYICRELCEREGAAIDHVPGAADERRGNVFVVTLRRAAGEPAAPPTAPALPLP